MKKQLLALFIAICIITSSVYSNPIQSQAITTSAGVTSAVAAKVLLTLLALAGVAVKASDVEFIWDEGGLNTEALINNMMLYSRDLGMGIRDMLSLGTAGATTIIFQRHIWNLFKGWARDKYGTDTSVSTPISTVVKEIAPVSANELIQLGYIESNQIGRINYHINTDLFVFRTATYNSKGYPIEMQLYFVPTTYQSINTIGSITNSYTNEGYTVPLGFGQFNYGNIGYGFASGVGADYITVFTSSSFNQDFIDLGGVNTGELQAIQQYITEYRENGSIDVTETIDAKPIIGLDDEAATTEGQDLVSYDTVATQDGQDVILEGPLAVALPEAATLEVLLRHLANDEITYEDYVQALGLAAVKTKENTVADVQEKEQAITVNPYAGNYKVSLSDLFPFCIPFDLYEIISAFEAEPTAPEVIISLPVVYDGTTFTWQDYTISLAAFDAVAQVVRVFEYIIFIVGLMLITRKLIEG